MMNANENVIAMLNRSKTFLDYNRAYAETIAMPLTLRPVGSWQLPFHGKQNENTFCALMSDKSGTCAACLRLQEMLTQDAMNQAATRTCAYGLCESAVPVRLGLQTIGFLQTGQVMRRKPTRAAFQRAVVHAGKLGVDIGNEQARRAYFRTPVISQKKLEAVSDLLAIFAEHLAVQSNQLAIQTMNVEPPFVTRARQFICEHYTEDLSLHIVSTTVNVSRFYFCKQFRKATGLSLTEFVARTRIEKAKNLLLNRNLRVSEIAYAIGFQSLTHFNRAFKKIMGQSPTQYRGQLPAPAKHRTASQFETRNNL